MSDREYEYWHTGITIGMTIFLCTIFTVIHSHVWTRNGYAGKNRILEDHEVDKFIAHVLSEASFTALFVVCMLEPMIVKHLHFQYTLETKGFLGAAFLGTGAYVVFGKRIRSQMKRCHASTKLIRKPL